MLLITQRASCLHSIDGHVHEINWTWVMSDMTNTRNVFTKGWKTDYCIAVIFAFYTFLKPNGYFGTGYISWNCKGITAANVMQSLRNLRQAN